MGPKKEFPYQGRRVIGQEIDTVSSNETWSAYTLEDGTVIKMKSVLLTIVRLDEHDATGNPIYMFTSHQIIGVTAPDDLKKKEN
ncbi:MAG: hypothetical protein ABI823_14945 [Bryobacteraceae bacterium]